MIFTGFAVTGGSCLCTTFLERGLSRRDVTKTRNIELYSVTVLDYGIGFGDLSIDSRYSRFESISLDGSVGLAGVDALKKKPRLT